MSYGIVYEVHCLTTGMRYVGQTVSMLRIRWRGHCNAALKRNLNWELSKAIREHGPEDFQLKILCECETKKELDVMERKFILELETLYPNGYNMLPGGNGQDELTRQLISERTKIAMAKIDPETRKIQKERQRQGLMGHEVSVEARRNQSVAQKKRKDGGELAVFFVAGGKSRKGSKHSLETKRLMSQNRRGKCKGDEHPMKLFENKRKISIANTGRKRSIESKQKMKEKAIQREKNKLYKRFSENQLRQALSFLNDGLTLTFVFKTLGIPTKILRRLKSHGETFFDK